MTGAAEVASTADVAAYWNERPCNLRHSPAEVGSRRYFDEVEQRKYFVEPHIRRFADFPRWKGKRVLEIGCGIGTDTVNFARAGAEVTSVDLSQASVDLCRRRLMEYGLDAQVLQVDAERLSEFVPVRPFDLIYSFGVIHHTPRPERVLAELRRYCGPQTELRVMLYSRWSWKVIWILLKYGRGRFWRLGELVRANSEAQTGCPVTFVYSFSEIRRLFAGYDVQEIWKDHIFPYEIEPYKRYEYREVWYFRYLPAQLFKRLEALLGWHTMIVARPRA